MVILYLLPLLFLVAASLWGVGILLFGVVTATQVVHDLAVRRPAAPRRVSAPLAAPIAAPGPGTPALAHFMATSRTLPYLAAATAILMWVIFLAIANSR